MLLRLVHLQNVLRKQTTGDGLPTNGIGMKRFMLVDANDIRCMMKLAQVLCRITPRYAFRKQS